MKKERLMKKVLSLALAVSMLFSFSVPAVAAENEGVTNGFAYEQVENDVVEASLLMDATAAVAEPETEYADDEVVRVSVVLEKDSVIDAGYSTEDILENSAALKYLQNVKSAQKTMEKKIAKVADFDVKHNLAIAANIISGEMEYGDVDKVESLDGVKEVVVETQYYPCAGTSADAPQMAVATNNMTGAAQAWAKGFTGAGARIAIIDTGLDIDHQSFDNDAFKYALKQDAKKALTTEKLYLKAIQLLDVNEINKALPYLNAYKEVEGNLTAADVKVSDKIPFAFNYVDGDTNVRHIYDTQGEHGSHVAGISTANRYLKQGNKYVDAIKTVGVAGNAPDAQVLVMKVFGKGGGAYDSDYMAAIEDAIVLGCDSVNLSLGSGNAGLATSKTYQDILDKLTKSNTVVVMSAGNSGAWAENTYLGDLYVDGVNYDTAGSPGSFTNSLGVASVDNIGTYGNSFKVAGEAYGYTETSGYGNVALETLANGSSTDYGYVFIEGFGEDSDFEGVDVNGKVVFVSRGTTSFFEKANNGAKNGAVATVVYNNQPGSISMNLTGYEYSAPVVSITQEQGAAIKAASVKEGNVYTGTITFDTEKGVMLSGADHYTISSFSSWGVPGNLSMKPEIAAPGGSIYSVNGSNDAGGGIDQYELMSGTSMAAPQITGMTAVLKRYIEIVGLPIRGFIGFKLNTRAIAQSLLMSTATPMTDADGYYYSVLQQGSGLANVNDAMNANSIVTMSSNATASYADGKVKVELGDDPARTGVYTFSFNITNTTLKNMTYNLSADMFTQATDGTFLYGDTMPIDGTTVFTVNGKSVKSVTVKLGQTVTVNVKMTLSADTKELFDTYYTAGAYVEAYVFAKPTDKSSAHSIPVLGFYGSWTDSSMYDIGSYIDYKYGFENRPPYLYANNKTNGNAFTVAFGDGSGEYYFGGNLYASDAAYRPEFASLNNTNGDMIKSINYALIRNAGNVVYRITDKKTGEVYATKSLGSQYGAYYYVNGSAWRNTSSRVNLSWTGTDANGNKLPEGTEVEISLIAAPEYYCDIDGNFDVNKLGKGAFFSTSLTIDNTAPDLRLFLDEPSGSLVTACYDNVATAAIYVFAENGKTLLETREIGTNNYVSMLGKGLEDGIYVVTAVDYAGNATTYKVFMNFSTTDKVEEVVLSESYITLMKNGTVALKAEVTPDNVSDNSVIWSSSDESVAKVDANGIVTAVAAGECVVTATSVLDPEKSDSCFVEVIEINKELNGIVWDEEGQVWVSQFNVGDLPNYTKLHGSSLNLPINGVAYGADGTVYATDIDTENGISNLYTVDLATLTPSLVGTSSIAYTEIAEAPHLNALLATYFNYIVLVDPETGDYMGAFDYLSDANIVGITYTGSVYNRNYGQYIDIYYLLDDAGRIYYEAFINLNGSYYYFNGEEDALMGGTGITADTPYFQSLYFDGEYTYASNYNDAKNRVDFYAIDTEVTGAVYNLGSFNDGVWPVAGLCEAFMTNATSAKADKFVEATAKEDVELTTVIEKQAMKVSK